MYIAEPHLDVAKFKDTSRVSPSSLKNFHDCPYCYWAKRVAKFWVDDGNEHFLLGGGADALITEGMEAYTERYQVVPRRTEALKEEAAEKGVELLSPKQDEIIRRMEKELSRQPLFAKFLAEGWEKQAWLETDIVDEFDGSSIHAVSKLDFYHKGAKIIADLKTTANLATFKPSMYALQMGFYHEMAQLVDGIDCQVFIIAVDKTDMTRSRIYMMSPYVIEEGKAHMRRAIERLKVCRETDGWLDEQFDEEKLHECPCYDTCPYAIQKRIILV